MGTKQNEKLAAALRDAKSQIVALKEEIDKLCAPPHSYGTFRKAHADGTIDVSVDGRTLKVNVHPTDHDPGAQGGAAAHAQRGLQCRWGRWL